MPLEKTHFEQVPIAIVKKIALLRSEEVVHPARPEIEPVIEITIPSPVKRATKRVRS
jgi:hypothetical protein